MTAPFQLTEFAGTSTLPIFWRKKNVAADMPTHRSASSSCSNDLRGRRAPSRVAEIRVASPRSESSRRRKYRHALSFRHAASARRKTGAVAQVRQKVWPSRLEQREARECTAAAAVRRRRRARKRAAGETQRERAHVLSVASRRRSDREAAAAVGGRSGCERVQIFDSRPQDARARPHVRTTAG